MSEIAFINEMRNKAKVLNGTVAFPDAEDLRTLKASAFLRDNAIAQPMLIGTEAKIKELADKNGIDLKNIVIIDPATHADHAKYSEMLFEKRKSKGMTIEEAKNLMLDPLYFSGMMLETNAVKVVVAGNVSSTGAVLRASIHTVGVAAGISIVSSYFIMVLPDGRMICFADCAVNPDPDYKQLADIAITTATNFKSVTGIEPKVAMLSFSTKGSAEHPLVEKVQMATQLVKEKAPHIECDGELQLDAALVPEIGERKSPGSTVAGHANVLVFPDLNAGNIGYKLVQRLAGAEAVGPIVQGLKKPYCDLSRGCSVDDMVNVATICSLMA